MFTNGFVVSECPRVHRLARFALSVGRKNSILSLNAIFFSILYGLDVGEVELWKIDKSCVRTLLTSLVSVELQ